MNVRRSLLSAITVGALVLGAGLAGAQTPVDVKGTAGASSRQLFVEDALGNDLATAGIQFGSGGAVPFQVRVRDEAWSNASFTVEATMTNLYVDNSGVLDFTKKIESKNVSVGTFANPLAVADIAAQLEPVFDTVTTINDVTVCTLLLTTAPCTLAVNDLTGVRRTVTYAAGNLADLSKLPIVPQSAATGAFTVPDYEGDPSNSGDTAADPNKPASFTATALRMLAGTPVAAEKLDVLTTLLNANLGSLTDLGRAARGAIVDETLFAGKAQDAVLAIAGTILTDTQLTTVLDSTTTLTREALSTAQIVSQTGAYRSFPVLSLKIPAGSSAGSYRGTLVITDIEP